MKATFHSEVQLEGGWEHHRKLAEVVFDPKTDECKSGCRDLHYQRKMGENITNISIGTKLNYIKDSTEKIIYEMGIIPFEELEICLTMNFTDTCMKCIFYYIFFTELDDFIYNRLPKPIQDYRIVFWISEEIRWKSIFVEIVMLSL